MNQGITLVNLDKVRKAIQSRAAALREAKLAMHVGYSAPYAVYVHEDMEASHVIGKAKFLSGPARRMRKQLADIVKEALKKGKTPRAALWESGKVLVAASTAEVPVDTGALKESVYIVVKK